MLDIWQAENTCANHQNLIGRKFNPAEENDTTIIDCVTIAPYDPVVKYRFLLDYKNTNDPETSLAFYDGPLFDVILIARIFTNKEIVVYKDLNSYLSEAAMFVASDDNLSTKNSIASL